MHTTVESGVVDALRGAVENDLDEVSSVSRNDTIQRGFEVVVRSDVTDEEAATLDRRDFVVYFVGAWVSDDMVRSVLRVTSGSAAMISRA